MFRSVATTLVLVLLFSSLADARPQYGWTLSASSTDPFQNVAVSADAMRYLYLWFSCASSEGMAAAEFDLGGSLPVYAVLPMNGVLNGGSGQSLFLAAAGCPNTMFCAATIVVGDFVPGDLCLVPSAANSRNGTFDCEEFPEIHPNTWVGFSSTGEAPCASASDLCLRPTSIDDRSFGAIKSLYR